MNPVYNKLILIATIFIAITSINTNAQILREKSLIGVDSMKVEVLISDNDYFNENQQSRLQRNLTNRMELELRRAGIGVGRNKNIASLKFQVLILDIQTGDILKGFAYSYNLSFSKGVYYYYGEDSSEGITWNEFGLAITTIDDLETSLKSTLDDELTEFLNDYLSAN